MVAESRFCGGFTFFLGGCGGGKIVFFKKNGLVLGFRIEMGFSVERKVKNE